MTAVLTGSVESVALDSPGYAVRAPGLQGTAEEFPKGATASRTTSRVLVGGFSHLDQALASEGVAEVKVIEVDLRPVPVAGATPLRSEANEPQLELEVPDLGPNKGQVVMSIDEAGAVRWHFPEPAKPSDGEASRGGGAVKRFRIVATVPPLPASDKVNQRSIFGAIGRRILRVFVYPITDPVVGFIADRIAKNFEDRKRPYGLRSFTAANRADANVPTLAKEEIAAMRDKGRILLFIHGTFSTAHGGFGDISAATLDTLHQVYEGRVIAFNHQTLSASPTDNVQWLLANLPNGDIEFDIVCHSRGGLVSRVIADNRAPVDTTRVSVRRLIFAATPNQGTALAEPDHMVNMLDRLTTALTLAPTGPVTETLEAIVTAVKVIGHAGLKSLDGLASMNPKGPFLGAMNAAGARARDYYAFASNYEPTDRGLRALVTGAADKAVDFIFREAGNDLVVPTDGVFQENGGNGFPMRDDHVFKFPPERGVMHTNFFSQPEVNKRLVEWLS